MILLTVYLLLIPIVSPYNLLIYNPVFGFSHFKFLCQISDILADAGHNITMFQPYHFSMKTADGVLKNPNIEVIKYFPDKFEEREHGGKNLKAFWDSFLINNMLMGSYRMPLVLTEEFRNTATKLLRDVKVLKMLEDRHFDAVISETFEITGHYVAHLINARAIIPVFSSARYPAVESHFGQGSLNGYVPGGGSKMAPNAGTWDRINDIYYNYFYKLTHVRFLDKQQAMFSEIIGGPLPDWRELVKKSPFYFTNSNPILNFAIPSTGNIIRIGGFNVDKNRKPQPLPEEYQKILNERKDTVFVSFGSVIKSADMPEHFKSGLITMFKILPEITFIWKYENENDIEFKSQLPANVHIRKWNPQPALLADKRVKLFITHGGLGSTMEAAYSGKPALMVPLFGDQPQNALMLSRHGGANVLDRYDLANGPKMSAIVREMISNPIYLKNAENLVEHLLNQPMNPKEVFVKNLEFAVRFPEFRGQFAEISESNFIEFYYLDAYIVIILISFCFFYLFFMVLFAIMNSCKSGGGRPKFE